MDTTTQIIYDTSVALLAHPDDASLLEHATTLASTSSRVVEVPWSASRLGRLSPHRVLDVGFSLASLDYLGLLLEYEKDPAHTVCAVDIVTPERVRTRYPQAWWPQIQSLDVRQADIRSNPVFDQPFEVITCVSVIEHIGFDTASVNDPNSAFVRQKTPEAVFTERPATVDTEVMSAMADLLEPGGRLILSVPMGQGGPVMLKDSLGYYCVQWEYDPDTWAKLVGNPSFAVEEEHFFMAEDDLTWHEVETASDLATLEAVPLSHSRGVGMTVLCKKHPQETSGR